MVVFWNEGVGYIKAVRRFVKKWAQGEKLPVQVYFPSLRVGALQNGE